MPEVELPLEQIKEILSSGDLVVLPTETVYGLAGNALDEKALSKIFRVKGRPLIDPLIVHVYDIEDVKQIAKPNDTVLKLTKHFWPGALTMIMEKQDCVPDLATAGLKTVGVRMPGHPVMRKVLKHCGCPLAAPSANPFGYVSPTESQHVQKTLGDQLKLVIDGGACSIGIESTILDVTNEEVPKILRPGPISRKSIETELGIAVELVDSKNNTDKAHAAPGLMKHHYSPRTPLYFLNDESSTEEIGVIYLKRPDKPEVNDFLAKREW